MLPFILLHTGDLTSPLSIVRNDYVSKPLSKGILDGNLLVEFEGLPITRQVEMTRQIGTERTVVLGDLIALGGVW
jgi:cleavage and polyadenylation specificity factor subunit 1